MSERRPSWEMNQKELMGSRSNAKVWWIIGGVVAVVVGAIVLLKHMI